MKNTFVNPYLPGWEYIPDAEPHVFQNRVYIYGSHDRADAAAYCVENYVTWSAPVEDLSQWRYECVSYRRDQDIQNKDGHIPLYAPDAAQGPDGRYYLYYAMWGTGTISVAVSNEPKGPFEFYSLVRYADGSNLYGGVRFDPAILSDETGIFLYYGFCPPGHYPDMGDAVNEGCYMVELEDDMCTAKTAPVCVAYGFEAKDGTGYAEHPYFEAPSIRRFGGKCYFIYSSLQGHELCYGMADTPRGPFEYKGVLISNGDLGYQRSGVPTAFYANNHGSIVKVGEDYLLFYHRHTHATHFSRQDCIEKLTMNPDGTFDQVEVTSSGINEGGMIPASGTYSAHIVCNLLGPDGAAKIPSKREEVPADFPYVYEERYGMTKDDNVLMVRNLRSGAACAVKYLNFDSVSRISVSVRGAAGKISVCLDHKDAEPIAILETADSQFWSEYSTKTDPIFGCHALWFRFETNEPGGIIDFKNFGF